MSLHGLLLLTGIEVHNLQLPLRVSQEEVAVLGQERACSIPVLVVHSLDHRAGVGVIYDGLLTA